MQGEKQTANRQRLQQNAAETKVRSRGVIRRIEIDKKHRVCPLSERVRFGSCECADWSRNVYWLTVVGIILAVNLALSRQESGVVIRPVQTS
jgi:hypothetical protein